MSAAELLPPSVLRRKAVIYVRQSTPTQVQTNREGQRRQYELVDVARRRGFRDVEVIDDDLEHFPINPAHSLLQRSSLRILRV